MQLHSLIITGFKSFPEAKLEFPKGITAVVGPNGAGKSNVVDAILWVLGEQSTKALRSDRMEDVIFNGTESRKPLGMAEVSLVVNNVTSQELEAISGLGQDLAGSKELMVTRRLFREGESEYFINKIPCRLKDIRSLFLEARAGTKGHTVIEQGNIDQLLSGSPQDRRSFIEETAGIGRFKKQKAEALRKLDATEQNLLRVRDIIGEVRKQLRSLERQARQAQTYQALQQESRALEVQLLVWDFQNLAESRRAVEEELADGELQEASQVAEEARFMATHEQAKATLLGEGATASRLQGELTKLEHDMGQTLTTVEVQRNRVQGYQQQQNQALEEQGRLALESEGVLASITELERQLSQFDAESARQDGVLGELETRDRDLMLRRSSTQEKVECARQRILELAVEKARKENQWKSLKDRQNALSDQLDQLGEDERGLEAKRESTLAELVDRRSRVQELANCLEVARVSHDQVRGTIQALETQIQGTDRQLVSQQTDRAAAESRLRALQSILHEEFGYGRGGEGEVPALREACQGIQEAIAERLEVPQEFEQAIEAVLGEKIRAWVVDGINNVNNAIAFLKRHRLGRGTFVPFQPYSAGGKKVGETPSWWPFLQEGNGVLGRALELVHAPDDIKPALSCFLGRMVIVQNLQTAFALLHKQEGDGFDSPIFVTLEGEVVDSFGVVSGGSAGDSSGLLQRRREVRTLEQHIQTLTSTVEENQRTRETLGQDWESTKNRAQTLDDSTKESERHFMMAERETAALEQILEDLEQNEQAVRKELEFCRNDQDQIERDLESGQSHLVQLNQEWKERESELEGLILLLREFDSEASELSNRLTEARLALTSLRERRNHHQADLTRLKHEEQARGLRLGVLEDQLQGLLRQIQVSQDEGAQAETQFQELEQKKDLIQLELRSVEERYAESLAQTRVLEHSLAELRPSLARTREKRTAGEVSLAEVRTRQQTLEQTLIGTYGRSIDEVLTEKSQGEEGQPSGDGHPETWREQLQEIRARLDRIGPVNLAAVEEHRELEERHGFLSKQDQDMAESITSIREIIIRLNRDTHRKFEETFQALQEKFGEVFAALFAGGKAELVLVAPEPDQGLGGFVEDPGVDIVAQPPGKRLRNLSMLSGGEKALTVLALLFASFLINPSPFCILDEVDGPLDEPNVVRFGRFLHQMADHSQFVVITHNKRTMEIADSLFGVTMEEPGVSKFVSVRLKELQQA